MIESVPGEARAGTGPKEIRSTLVQSHCIQSLLNINNNLHPIVAFTWYNREGVRGMVRGAGSCRQKIAQIEFYDSDIKDISSDM